MRRAITLKDASLFFLPLIFTAEMVMLTHSVIHASLARQPDPQTVLAGYSVAFSFFSALGSPIWTLQFITLAFVKDQYAAKQLLRYMGGLLLIIFSIVAAIVFTPLSGWLFGVVFGASPPAVAQGRIALLILYFGLPMAGTRSIFYALIMKRRKTLFITIGTFLRLASLALWLNLLPYFLSGAAVGAGSLALCMTVEMVFCMVAARRFYTDLPRREGQPASLLKIWLFSWPLMLNGITETGITLVINFFLGRLANPDLSLASFGVMWGIIMVFMSPLRNIIQTTQTLVNAPGDMRIMFRFTTRVAVIFGCLALGIFATPVGARFLDVVMGLPEEIARTIQPALVLGFVMAFAWSFASLSRGILSRLHLTGSLATSGMMRLVMVLLIGSVALVFPNSNGAVLGMCALIGAVSAELVVLSSRVWQLKRSGGLTID